MDSELVRDSESDDTGGGKPRPRSLTYKEQFEQLFPFYLAMGMTYEEYWNGDSTLVKAYRKAQELKKQMQNELLWLQGMYFYEALCCVAPILKAFSKQRKPVPYRDSPYPLDASQQGASDPEKVKYDKQKAKMEAFMVSFNKRFEKKGG